nr:hypothetical protein CFP56_24028 [Quercus suber]
MASRQSRNATHDVWTPGGSRSSTWGAERHGRGLAAGWTEGRRTVGGRLRAYATRRYDTTQRPASSRTAPLSCWTASIGWALP